MDMVGTVTQGSGRAFKPQGDADLPILGYEPHPNTLRVRVSPKIRYWISQWPGVSVPNNSRPRKIYIPAKINEKVDCHIHLDQGASSVDVIAEADLRRSLGLRNGHKVLLQVRQTPIPKILHQIWVGPPMPDHLQKYREMWQETHPDWDLKLWGEEDLDWLEHQDLFDDWETHAPRNRGQWQANIARLEILYKYGGVYADSDMQPLRSINPLMEKVNRGAFCVWQRELGHPKGPLLSNAFCGSYAGHSTIRSLLDRLRHNVRRYDGRRCTYTSGVKYWTKHIFRSDLTGHLDIFGQEVAMPYLPDKISDINPDNYDAPEGAYLAHHWHNQRAGGNTGKYR